METIKIIGIVLSVLFALSLLCAFTSLPYMLLRKNIIAKLRDRCATSSDERINEVLKSLGLDQLEEYIIGLPDYKNPPPPPRKDAFKHNVTFKLDVGPGFKALEKMLFESTSDDDHTVRMLRATENAMDRQSLQIEDLKTRNATLEKELDLLKNPPQPPKFKVGDVIGKFAISKVALSGTECDPHHCIDKEGELYRFSESEIEAMMKLNEVQP